ncbi:MAG: C4-type zinc ribbon domain-containing protein [Chloroflexota bacterium]|nr:C4-type zinc ribbon domain-containing protein [Chloroflexota bacterium]
MNHTEQLYHLQLADSELDRLGRRLREVEASLGETNELHQARADSQAAEQELNRWQVKLRDLELENASLTSKLKANEQRLYSGTVKNPRELTSLQEEKEYLKRRKSHLEDTILETMIEVEDSQEQAHKAQEHLTQVEEQWQADQERLSAEREELQTSLPALSEKRQVLRAAIPPDDVGIYDDLRQRKGGQAVATLKGDTCQGCQVSLPSSKAQQVHQGQTLVLCGSCGRILYAL